MIETMLLLLLVLGGGTDSPAASPQLGPAPGISAPVTGVWRGKWFAQGDRPPVPVEAVLAPGREAGTLIAVVVSGFGRERWIARLGGRYDNDGASLALPSGGALRLMLESGTRLIGDVKVGGATGFVPGDGAVELIRVRR